jgi:hypothetical protein
MDPIKLGSRLATLDPRRASLASEAFRHGQTRELGNAHPATDRSKGSMCLGGMLAGRTTPALAGSGVGCGLAGRTRPVPTQSDAASWPSPHVSNSHSFRGPPPFPCPTKVCARGDRVNGLCGISCERRESRAAARRRRERRRCFLRKRRRRRRIPSAMREQLQRGRAVVV